MRNSQREKGSFFILLVRNYVGFTLAVVVMVLCTLGVAYWSMERMLEPPDISRIVGYQEQLKAGEYDRIPVERVLGMGAGLEVLDGSHMIIYSSRGEIRDPLRYTHGELDFIADYDRDIYADRAEYVNGEGETRILITMGEYGSQVNTTKAFMVLDKDLNILSSTKPMKHTSLTRQQLGFLTGKLPSSHHIKKYPFTVSGGESRTLLIRTPRLTDAQLGHAFFSIKAAACVFLILYVLMIAGFVIWLNRKVKKPITLLNNAILDFTEGKQKEDISYTGPSEFVKICDSFNRMSQQLRESEEKRKKLEADKQKMLADISHDLRTPVTVIQGYSKAICDGLVREDKKQQYLNTIVHKANGLTDLIDAFHEYSKMEHPDFQLHRERLDICEVARGYLAGKYDEISLAGFSLEADIPEECIWCSLDRLLVRRSMDNIISNALKHNPRNTGILYSIERLDAQVRIVIADSGTGIPKKLIPNVFEPFAVGDDSRNNKKGSGLGLAISQKLIEAHGGQIRLISPAREGYSTELEILLPLASGTGAEPR